MLQANSAAGNLKVPEVTAAFWAIKCLTTGMGETTSDFLVTRFDPPVVVALAALAWAAAMALQLLWPRFNPFVYWFGVVMVGIFGTMAADVPHALGLGYLACTLGYSAALAVIFALWHRTEGTLAVHSITTRRRELFYWATVLATFALGTAWGDLAAHATGLGYFAAGIIFAALIAVPAAAYRFGLLPAVPAFWLAYILTRPLGASFADWLGASVARGGLGLGTGPVSLVAGLLIALGVWATSATGRPGVSRPTAGAQ